MTKNQYVGWVVTASLSVVLVGACGGRSNPPTRAQTNTRAAGVKAPDIAILIDVQSYEDPEGEQIGVEVVWATQARAVADIVEHVVREIIDTTDCTAALVTRDPAGLPDLPNDWVAKATDIDLTKDVRAVLRIENLVSQRVTGPEYFSESGGFPVESDGARTEARVTLSDARGTPLIDRHVEATPSFPKKLRVYVGQDRVVGGGTAYDFGEKLAPEVVAELSGAGICGPRV